MKYLIALLVNLYLFCIILDTEFLFLKNKNTMCVFWKKKLIDVKISAQLPVFLTTLNLVAFPEKSSQ